MLGIGEQTMKTKEDKLKQAQAEVEAALAKRNVAWRMWIEAGEELAKARMKLGEIADGRK